MPKQTEQIDTTFMATDIIMQPVSTLIPYANNARTHSDAQIKQIAASIQAFGFTNPVLVDGQNGIIAGHGRILAAELLGISEVPTICLPHLTNTAKRAYVLADNRIAINSGWDMETLAVEVQRIIDDGRYDINDLGFDSAEVDEMLASIINGQGGQPLTDPDDVPELPTTTPVSKRGDIWICGEHRVMCGDSTDRADVDVLMDGRKADMVFTDPPYGVSIVNTGGGGVVKFGKVGGCGVVEAKVYAEVEGDGDTEASKAFYELCISMDFDNYIIFGGNYFTDFLPPSPCWIVWDKQNSGNFADVELAWCSLSRSAKLYSFTWNGMSREGDRRTELATRVHPTQKPVGLFVQIFNDFDFKSCFDGFLGSGTTLIACQSTSRICYGMEISPAYVDVIVNRWQNYTGLQAVNANTGLSFNDTQEASNAL